MSWDDPSGLRDPRGGSAVFEIVAGIASALIMLAIVASAVEAIGTAF